MNKIILAISLFLIWGTGVNAQNNNVESANNYLKDYNEYNGGAAALAKAREKIDLAKDHENTKDKARTWYIRGKIYLASFDNLLKTEMGKSTETDINKKLISAYSAMPMDYAEEARVSFEKELQLDDKKVFSAESSSKLNVIAYHFSVKADAQLSTKNYSEAIGNYEKAMAMRSKAGITDTSAINNIAFCAVKSKDYKKAAENYMKLIGMNYKVEKNYLYLIGLHKEAGDTIASNQAIAKARAAVPDSYKILVEEINIYTTGIDKETNADKRSQAASKGIELLSTAIAKNPNDPQLHMVLAALYNKLAFPKDADKKPMAKPANFNDLITKAEDHYKKAVELKSDFTSNSEMGIFYYNWAADINNGLEDIKDPKKKKEADSQKDAFLNKAIVFLEKAHNLDSTDRNVIKALKEIYYRLDNGESERYKNMNQKFKGAAGVK